MKKKPNNSQIPDIRRAAALIRELLDAVDELNDRVSALESVTEPEPEVPERPNLLKELGLGRDPPWQPPQDRTTSSKPE